MKGRDEILRVQHVGSIQNISKSKNLKDSGISELPVFSILSKMPSSPQTKDDSKALQSSQTLGSGSDVEPPLPLFSNDEHSVGAGELLRKPCVPPVHEASGLSSRPSDFFIGVRMVPTVHLGMKLLSA
jgi:hypothetical protein